MKTTAKQSAWPKRPRQRVHAFLGPVQQWMHTSGRVRIDRYTAASGRYLALVADLEQGGVWCLISAHYTLAAAQRACQRHLKGKPDHATP